MKKNHLYILLSVITVALISFSGCVNNIQDNVFVQQIADEFSNMAELKILNEKNIGGKYNATIVTVEIPIKDKSYRKNIGKDYIERTEIHYSIGDVQYRGYYFSNYFTSYNDSLDWISVHTPEDSIFLNWCDYGHTIRGVTGRDVVISENSKEKSASDRLIATGIMDEKTYETIYGFELPEKVEDVVLALTTNDIEITNQIMDKYRANYIYVTMHDLDIIDSMLIGSHSFDKYWGMRTNEGKRIRPIAFYNSTLARLLLFDGRDLENYQLVYESSNFNSKSKEMDYKVTYNEYFGGNLQVKDTGYIKIFKYMKDI